MVCVADPGGRNDKVRLRRQRYNGCGIPVIHGTRHAAIHQIDHRSGTQEVHSDPAPHFSAAEEEDFFAVKRRITAVFQRPQTTLTGTEAGFDHLDSAGVGEKHIFSGCDIGIHAGAGQFCRAVF